MRDDVRRNGPAKDSTAECPKCLDKCLDECLLVDRRLLLRAMTTECHTETSVAS